MTIAMTDAVRETQSAEMPEVSGGDLNAMFAAMQCIEAVQAWDRRGRPDDEIEMTTKNVMTAGCHRYRVAYTDVRNRVMQECGMEERELVRRVLTRFAVAAPEPVKRR